MNQSITSFACASLLGILLASQTNTAKAAEITVCPSICDQTTVQAGIDAAVSGDTVVVGTPGHTENGVSETYIVNNIQLKEGVSVVSEGPITETYIDYTNPFVQGVPFDKVDEYREKKVLKRATLTILQGLGDDTVISFPDGADNAVLDGFIVENINDTASNKQLIKVVDCSPTIKNNIVRDNEGLGQSGGITIAGGTNVAAPLIQDNVIHYVNGSGIGVSGKSYPTIIDNEIFTTPPVINSAPPQGVPFRNAPGIGFQNDSAATILGNHIFLNGAAGISSKGPLEPDGTALGGVYNFPGYEFDIRGNTIHHNLSAAGIGIFGKPGEEFPTTEVNCTIGGPDPTNINDRNTINDNYIGVRVGFWKDSTSKSLGAVVVQNNDIDSSRQPGMLIVNTTSAEIKHNTVHANKKVGILVNQNKNLTIEYNTVTENGQASTTQGGGIWLRNNNTDYTVLVQNNQISGNMAGGMRVEGYSLKAVIKENMITNNGRGGIKIMRVTDLNIIDNEIADNGRGGIHTGTFQAGGGNIPTGLPVIIRGNKVHNNGSGDFGGGIDVRHAAGTIENNIVYKNHMGGIRFGDWISAINHNTVVNNGLISSDLGGGIVYDDLDGDVNALPSGFPDVAIPIRNNILVGNVQAGINTGTISGGLCSDWVDYRDYNLLSGNNGAGESCNGEPWCERPQLASCAGNPNEIFAAPLFVDPDAVDYHLQASSPAVDAGDPLFPDDVQPPGLGDLRADMGAYGGEYGINW